MLDNVSAFMLIKHSILPLVLGSCGLNTPEFLPSPGKYCSKFLIVSIPPTSYIIQDK